MLLSQRNMKSRLNKNRLSIKFAPKIVAANGFMLPFVTTLTLLFLALETVTYSGFIARYVFVEIKIIMVINILMLIVYVFKNGANRNVDKFESTLMSLVVKGAYLALPLLAILYYIMIAIESANYPNYVFSTTHINPDTFFNILVFVAIIALSGILSHSHMENLEVYSKGLDIKGLKTEKMNSQLNFNLFGAKAQRIIAMLLVVTFSYFVLQNVILTTKRIVKSNIYIFVNSTDTYDDKMYKSWHFFYKYMKFIKDNTPEDSSVAIPPPERPWLSEGNSVLVRYFLFPRRIVTVEDESGVKIDPDYYIISKGIWKAYNESEYGWPKEKINASEIIYLDPNSFEIEKVEDVVYEPELFENKMGWGIIKVKK